MSWPKHIRMETGRSFSSSATVHPINQRLDTKEQIELLVEECPLGSQLPPDERAIHEEWLPTVVFARVVPRLVTSA